MGPVAYAIAAAMCTYPLALAQQESIPTFGTNVVIPGGLLGVVYYIPPRSNSLPYFPSLDPVGVIYTPSLNVAPRNFREGFPGVTNRFEWFAIDYSGRFWIEKPDTYQFALTSDDGSKLYIDDELIVDNDGVHPPQLKTASIRLSGGIHRIRLSYFQGPADQVALILQVARPGEAWRVFSTDDFKPPPNPETWPYPEGDHNPASAVARAELRVSPAAASPGDEVAVEVSLQSAPQNKPLALTWEVVVPAQVVELVGSGPETGRAVADSGNSVRCSVQKSYLYFCTLAGDRKPLPSGSIAIFHFKIRSDAQRGTTAFRIEQVEATSQNRQFTLTGAEGMLTIH